MLAFDAYEVHFAETSGPALEYARVPADAFGASLHLLHVIGCPLATSRTARRKRHQTCGHLEALLTADDRDRRRPALEPHDHPDSNRAWNDRVEMDVLDAFQRFTRQP